MTPFEEQIVAGLVVAKVLTAQQAEELKQGLEKSQFSFEGYLTKKLRVPSEQLLKAKGRVAQAPVMKVEDVAGISPDVLRHIPVEASQQYRMVPLAQDETKLTVGMVDPTNFKAQEALRFVLLRSELEPLVVTLLEDDYDQVFARYRGLKREVKSALEELEQSLSEDAGSRPRKKTDEVEDDVLKEAPITKMVAVILKHAIEGNASDIHIEAGRIESRVRFRLDGTLYTSLLLPKNVHNSVVARIKILSSLRLDEQRIPQDGRFSTQLNGKSIDFRVSTFPTSEGEKVVMRILDPTTALLDMKQMGLVGPNLRILEKALELPFGMILVSGPTGSGKSTTLYASLAKVNKEGVNIVSLEDPVEYYMEGVSQSQVRPEIEYTFASGLRHILRQDPDIIMVGEIRDGETARLATQASLTGHLVFSTIHTNNAIGVIPRLIDMGVEAFLLPSSLTLTMAQRLVGRLCPYCKKEEAPHPRVAEMIDEELSHVPPEVLKEFNIAKPYKVMVSEGCARCNNKKTKGRIAIFEMLKITPELKQVILSYPDDTRIQEEAKRQGMITMRQDGIMKALQGIVSLEDVLRKVEEV
ncbi:MAG: GspE/PulE family protein [Candidatus Spechtbacterales bacterium]